jgi:His-Xaa-Ser system radical SAM maturase HxsC
LPLERRANVVFATEDVNLDNQQLNGYGAVLTTERLEPHLQVVPTIQALQHIDHLRTDDIVAVEPANGFVRTLYRPDSDYNVIFATQRCNSNCLMCSQPPQDRDDATASVERNLRLIDLIDKPPKRLVITGGEPTLLGNKLFSIIAAAEKKFPQTHLHMLTNGRAFAWRSFTSELASLRHSNFSLGIPLYSDDSTTHDYIVQAKGAFDQTVLGFQQLARYGLRIEIRVVLHALTIPRLTKLADYIYRNCTFVEHIALMGLENIGYAPRNMSELWIDPYDYQDELQETVEFLSVRGLNVSIYNHQLCVLKKPLWRFAKKSISDWKNIYLDQCHSCVAQNECGGFFQWATKLHSAHIRPLTGIQQS